MGTKSIQSVRRQTENWKWARTRHGVLDKVKEMSAKLSAFRIIVRPFVNGHSGVTHFLFSVFRTFTFLKNTLH